MQTTNLKDIAQNPDLSVRQKVKLALILKEPKTTFTEICKCAGISRPNAYKALDDEWSGEKGVEAKNKILFAVFGEQL
jgi:hypothetical protein